MSDFDAVYFPEDRMPIDLTKDYLIFSPENFEKIIETEIQIIWGVISAVRKNETPNFDKQNSPFVEGNDEVWENDKFQVENSVLEITVWDSSYTIIKFKDSELSRKFKVEFDEAIELDKYKF